MANRNLSKDELLIANELLADLRAKLNLLSKEDPALLFAYRRKLAKELTYDERGKPMHRKMLKARKMGEQQGVCAICPDALPDRYAVLDRIDGMAGYTAANTRLICGKCDMAIQVQRKYQ